MWNVRLLIIIDTLPGRPLTVNVPAASGAGLTIVTDPNGPPLKSGWQELCRMNPGAGKMHAGGDGLGLKPPDERNPHVAAEKAD
jgi:hypothetical protein